MKWIIIQSGGEHKKNCHLRECLSLQYALQQNGESADIWGIRFPNFSDAPDFTKYDRLLCIENYETGWLPDFGSVEGPLKIQWIIDLHVGDPSRYMKISKDMDVILHSTKSLMQPFSDRLPNKKHVWFPNGFDERYFVLHSIDKRIDVGFVGTPLNRKNWIESLIRDIGLRYAYKIGEDMTTTISSMKVHFNKPIGPDVNYRNFETIGLGVCLCTERMEELEELGFEDGNNCLMYSSYEECVSKIRDCLASGKWAEIGERGLEFSKMHTYTKRIKNLILENINIS